MGLGRHNIEVNDNTEQFLEYLDKAIVNGLTAIGMTAEGHAKRKITDYPAVDTGRLRNSITFEVDKKEPAVYIGTNVEYGPYVELGTSKMPPRPFLKPAATEHSEEYKRIMEAALKSAEM